MESTASEYFGSRVAEYDSLLRRAVPRYDEMIARIVEYVPPGRKRILDLGCGTGNLTVALAGRFPDAAFTLVDASREMLDTAAQRLSGTHEVRCLEATFETVELEPGSHDLASSCIALHHVVDKVPCSDASTRPSRPVGASPSPTRCAARPTPITRSTGAG